VPRLKSAFEIPILRLYCWLTDVKEIKREWPLDGCYGILVLADKCLFQKLPRNK
jgi:hypothetical protein